MKRIISVLCAISLIVGIMAPTAMADMQDVSPDHWAYEAVSDLADKGLVLGYPDGKFLGNRTLSRYEMATIIKRVIDYVDGQVDSKPSSTTSNDIKDVNISEADLNTLRKLVEEYKVELTVIGADIKQVKEDMEALKADMEEIKADTKVLNAQVVDAEGALPTVVNDVSKLKKLKLSGYVQARLNDGRAPGSVSDISTFNVRRVRLKAEAAFGSKTKTILQMDAGGTNANNSVTLRDAYVDYLWGESWETGYTLTLGQFKVPFGFELVQSSGDRDMPERSPVVGVLFPGERDRGFMITSPPSNLWWQVGVFNGIGLRGSAPTAGNNSPGNNYFYPDGFSDNNRMKDVAGRIRYKFNDYLDLGISGYYGYQGGGTLPKYDKTRYGGDFQFLVPWLPMTIRGEYFAGKDPFRSSTNVVSEREVFGGYVQANYSLNPSLMLVGRYDQLLDGNFAASASGRQEDYSAGLIKYLDDTTRLKLFYTWKEESQNSVKNNVATLEVITKF